ncbi:MAG: cbb3-type cytochrome oxidase assembly protein CcoS [Thiotrichales bacterium]|jgi:cbb3-type cytochrome oxidase maturation protein|nr:cbb3-type cytochrome oxidase assembly protein CcoS [Pseudomonadota bacterium]MCI4411390.1 cbb3-type cytochrome oxidase assembly protein CcoS [Thiotrichales bacterium]
MEVIYGLIPSVIFVGALVVIAIIWAAKKGQFDDLDGAGSRILMDDDEQPFAVPKDKYARTEDESPKA